MSESKRFFNLFLSAFVIAVLASCDTNHDQVDPKSTLDDWPNDLAVPIQGATFSISTEHLPGARTESGTPHLQGFAFFSGSSGRPLSQDEAIVAIADGEVVHIDHNYSEPDTQTLQFWAEQVESSGFLGEFALNHLRGRQVWLRHADGHISRYAHLSRVHPELQLGDSVIQGQPIGLMGTSGVVPTEDRAAPQPRLHFELWAADGDRYLGQNLTALEIHQQVAALFSGQALPRYARRMIAQLEAGQPAPDDYPPNPLPETAFDADPPDILIKGSPFAAAITWESDDFEARDFFALLGGRPLGIIEAPDGAWILGAISAQAEEEELDLVVGAADAFGQTLVGNRQLQIMGTEGQPLPLEVESTSLQFYTEENRTVESERLAPISMASLQQSRPEWQEPFALPLEGAVVQRFSQPIFHGMLRPSHPSPGITIVPDADTTVRASNDGVVALAGNLPIRGNTVALIHGGGVVSVYAHLGEMGVEPGDRVARGEPLGTAGQSGATTRQRQVRWEIHVAGTPSNPIAWLDRTLPRRQG